jgi:hypothetical protein
MEKIMVICDNVEVQVRQVQSDKPFLVDVPVKINIWIREACQRAQFEVLKKARPSILFVTSDGGRNEKEWAIIRKHREMFDTEIDWQCTVYNLYMDENKGMYGMGRYRTELIWSTVDRCIMLEDDIVPSISFFRFCAEMLERYKDDPRIECVCGMNHLGVWEPATADYFFSRQGSIWGYATWKRAVDDRGDFGYGADAYTMSLLKQRTKNNPKFWKRIAAYASQEHFEGHIAATEFWIEFHMYAQNRLQIIPKRNMICNMGYGADSAHAKGEKYFVADTRNLFNMKTYELEREIRHNKYVIPDVDYEKKRNALLGYNDSWATLRHSVEGFFLKVKYDGLFGWLIKGIKRRLNKNQIIEK